MSPPNDLSLAGWLLFQTVTTLQERAFCRLVKSISTGYITFRLSTHCSVSEDKEWGIGPDLPTVSSFLSATAKNPNAKAVLSALPIGQRETTTNQNKELVPALQDLADIIACEASDAFRLDFYPGIPTMSISEEHVKAVMVGLQREMDREARSRTRKPTMFSDLPWDRQVALAERRRYWYGQFGITPENWADGKWSLWNVTDTNYPMEYEKRCR